MACPYCGGGKKYGHYPGCPNALRRRAGTDALKGGKG
jgi:hypothetical protein